MAGGLPLLCGDVPDPGRDWFAHYPAGHGDGKGERERIASWYPFFLNPLAPVNGLVPGSEIFYQFLIITGIVRVDFLPGHDGDCQDYKAEHEREEESKVKAGSEHGELEYLRG